MTDYKYKFAYKALPTGKFPHAIDVFRTEEWIFHYNFTSKYVLILTLNFLWVNVTPTLSNIAFFFSSGVSTATYTHRVVKFSYFRPTEGQGQIRIENYIAQSASKEFAAIFILLHQNTLQSCIQFSILLKGVNHARMDLIIVKGQ